MTHIHAWPWGGKCTHTNWHPVSVTAFSDFIPHPCHSSSETQAAQIKASLSAWIAYMQKVQKASFVPSGSHSKRALCSSSVHRPRHSNAANMKERKSPRERYNNVIDGKCEQSESVHISSCVPQSSVQECNMSALTGWNALAHAAGSGPGGIMFPSYSTPPRLFVSPC